MENLEKTFPKTSINWYPGHMPKAKREIKEKIDLIDIVFEVIDARIPISSKNKDIDELIKNKPRILIMTKKDLCDIDKTKFFVDFYENKGYKVVLLDLLRESVNKILIEAINPIIEQINDKRRLKGMKPRKIRVLVLGIPNVGKSTLINRFVGKKVVNTGNRPGITKKLEWIRVNDKIELLDTPGILWPKLDTEEIALNLAATTAIKEEILNLEDVAIYIINKMNNLYPSNIEKRYNIKTDDDILKILDTIGKKIGAKKANDFDYEKVYKTVIKDLRDGYLGNVTFDWGNYYTSFIIFIYFYLQLKFKML